MPLFLVRIELHGAERDKNAYPKLHAAMERAGFRRFVTYPGVGSYWLPNAEYLTEAASGTKSTVRSASTAAAQTTGYNHTAFICEIYQAEYCSTALVEKKP